MTNENNMTTIAPEQMRALAEEHDEEAHEYVLDKAEKEGQPEYGDLYEYEDRIVWHLATAAALRAAADRLEAAQALAEVMADVGTTDEAALAGKVLDILAADTAPQDDRHE